MTAPKHRVPWPAARAVRQTAQSESASTTEQPLLRLQQQAGNQAVQRLLQRDDVLDQPWEVPSPPTPNPETQGNAEGVGGSGPQTQVDQAQADWDQRHAEEGPNPNMGAEGAGGSGTDTDRPQAHRYPWIEQRLNTDLPTMMAWGGASRAVQQAIPSFGTAMEGPPQALPEGPGEPIPESVPPGSEPPTLPRIPSGKPPSPYGEEPRIGFGRDPEAGGGPPGRLDEPPRIGFGRDPGPPDPGAPRSLYREDPKIGF